MKEHGFSRILLATDGGEQAAAAETVVAALARSSGASVEVVHVWNLEAHNRPDVETRKDAALIVDDCLNRLRAAGIEAGGEIVQGDERHIATALKKAASQFGADLVVVGSRGLSDWQAMTKHSTSHQLLSSIDCPVLVVRSTAPGPAHDGQRVLLALAGGGDIAPAVRATVAAATAPGSQVMVAHVKQSIAGVQGFFYVEPEDEVRETMAAALTQLKDAGICAQTVVAHAGPVAETVAELAANWNADLIVMGSSRMGDLESLILGSVTHQLLRAAQRPVLIAERVKA